MLTRILKSRLIIFLRFVLIVFVLYRIFLVLVVICAFLTLKPQPQPELSLIAEQFKPDHIVIQPSFPLAMILPDQVGEFARQSLESGVFDTGDQQRWATAVYSSASGGEIALSIWEADTEDVAKIWQTHRGFFENFSCGDLVGSIIAYHNAPFPYIYGDCSGWGFEQHLFRWANNRWLIEASTQFPNVPEVHKLVEFVNNYPY
jgi:hypothetical protein